MSARARRDETRAALRARETYGTPETITATDADGHALTLTRTSGGGITVTSGRLHVAALAPHQVDVLRAWLSDPPF